MDVKHRITINSLDKCFLSSIKQMGVEFKVSPLPGALGQLITIIILESDPNWERMVDLVTAQSNYEIYGDGAQYESIFSEDEIRSARWLRLISSFEQGYPQPRLHWPIKQLSYDLFCTKCAIYNQVGSMRLAKEPFLGNKSFMSLIANGEFFARHVVFEKLKNIQARGYEDLEAIIHKTGNPSEMVGQLYVPNITEPGFLPDANHAKVICPVCRTEKYYPHMKGILKYKKRAIQPDLDFIRTYEWFGSGYVAWREILVSNRIAKLILDNKWEGIRLKVVELV